MMGNGNHRPSVPPPPPPEDQPDGADPTLPTSVRIEVDPEFVQEACNTSGFETDGFLSIRRGVQFSVAVHASRKLSISTVVLVDYPAKDNSVQLSFEEDASRTTRSATELRLSIPADLPVGEYELRVSGRTASDEKFQARLRRHVVVLFNAWSQQDAVFMENAGYRDEYVLNSRGRVYAGSLYGMPWNLALYREKTLQAVLLLLRKSSLSFEQRRSPVLVSREMSAMVNVQGDRGVLVGNWSGNYEDGTAPSDWRGSGKILQQYLQGNGVPVRYGQCWVFSGVLLTVLRVLGIPARSVTNFSSAHDTNRNRTIDEYYSESGEKISYLSSGSDSVW